MHNFLMSVFVEVINVPNLCNMLVGVGNFFNGFHLDKMI